jgi:hypothetical protein
MSKESHQKMLSNAREREKLFELPPNRQTGRTETYYKGKLWKRDSTRKNLKRKL